MDCCAHEGPAAGDARFDLRVDEAASGDSIPHQRQDHLGQQVVGFAHVGIVAEDAGAGKVAIVRLVVLDGVKDDGRPGKFATEVDCGLYAVERAGELHIHQAHVGRPLG